MKKKQIHWIENGDGFKCPKCGKFGTYRPSMHKGCCPLCGFQDPDYKEEGKDGKKV